MTLPADDATPTERRLLRSIVEVARHAFGAAASSIFLVDPDTGELVFEAVAGEGDDRLVGTRFPAGTGIAGWVVASGQTMLVDDLRESKHFAGDAAESTGYVPNSIMAAPLFGDDACIGVLEVLDRGVHEVREMADVELLDLLADQAAIGLELLTRLRATGPDRRAEKALRLFAVAESLFTGRHG
ncbi:GAF domain-containing protein [Streptomyces sp. BI20]|uniref:GAF domain-containing protein n=1 Tax=Streptomyces sp. BI20 TaxID=3403460 RepID=UPI003C73BE39